MFECNKCKEYGLEFNRQYEPSEFIEGKLNSRIWIIGLNPAAEQDWTDEGRGVNELANSFEDLDVIHSYFKDFKKVSLELFEMLGKSGGVAHTDLVKCSSKRWPPGKGSEEKKIISNCAPYLISQIILFKPEIIICNGAPVSHQIQNILKADFWLSDTAYESNIEGVKVTVVLSGFIGRIDDFSKRRLGYEIESLIKRDKWIKSS